MKHAYLLVSIAAALALHAQEQAVAGQAVSSALQHADEALAKGRFAEGQELLQSAWTLVQLEGPGNERYPADVQRVVNAYTSIGQDLKAGQILHDAELSVVRFPAAHPARLSILTLKAQTYSNQGRALEAQAVYEQLLPGQEKVFGPDSFEYRGTLAALADSYERSGDLEKAESLFARLDDLSRKPTHPAAAPGAILMVNGRTFSRINHFGFSVHGAMFFGSAQLGGFYDRHGRFADAEKAYQAAIARAESAGSQDLDTTLSNYAIFLRNRRRYAEAEQIQLRIIGLHQHSAESTDLNRAIFDRQNLAELYLDTQEFEKADKVYEEARQDVLARAGRDSNEYYNWQQNHFFALKRENKRDEAARLAEEMLQQAPDAPNDYRRPNALNLMAQIRDEAGDHEAAESYRKQARELQQSQPNDWDPEGIGADVENAQALLQKGNAGEAWPRIEHALAATENAEPFKATSFLQQIANLAFSLNEKDSDKAGEMMQRIMAIENRDFGPAHPLYNPWFAANYYQSHGRPADAVQIWRARLTAIETASGPDSPRLDDPLQQIANLLNQQARHRDALAAAERDLAIQEKTRGPSSQETFFALGRLAPYYFICDEPERAFASLERQIRISARFHGATIDHALTLINAAVNYQSNGRIDRAIELATQAVELAGQADSDPHASDYFRQVLDSALKQKKAEQAESTGRG